MPKVDRWARLTVRLPAATYRRLEALAEEIPGMTPNALIRLAMLSPTRRVAPSLVILRIAIFQKSRAARSISAANFSIVADTIAICS